MGEAATLITGLALGAAVTLAAVIAREQMRSRGERIDAAERAMSSAEARLGALVASVAAAVERIDALERRTHAIDRDCDLLASRAQVKRQR